MIISTVLMTFGIKKAKKENKKTMEIAFKVMAFLIPFIIMGLRYDVGQDYFYTYVPVFEKVRLTGVFDNVEWGYVLLNKLVLLFTQDYAGIFIVTTALFCGFIYKAIMQQSKDISLSIYILFASCFFFYAMNVTRQSIAIAIFIYAIKYIKEKKILKYIIFILLASLIHKIALIFIPVYFIANLKIDIKKLIILTCIVVLGDAIINTFIFRLVQGTKYENYINGRYVVTENSMISPIINITTLALCLYYRKKDAKKGIKDEELNIFTNIHILAFLCSLLIGTFPLASRVFVNFYHVQILTIPYLLYKENRKQMKILMYLLYILGFAGIFGYSVGLKNGNKVLPYQTIFDRK